MGKVMASELTFARFKPAFAQRANTSAGKPAGNFRDVPQFARFRVHAVIDMACTALLYIVGHVHHPYQGILAGIIR